MTTPATKPDAAAQAKPAEPAKTPETAAPAKTPEAIAQEAADAEAALAAAAAEPETPVPSDDDLNTMDAASGYVAGVTEEEAAAAAEVSAKLVRMLNMMPADARDSLILYGYSGTHLTLGDLRALLKGHPDLS